MPSAGADAAESDRVPGGGALAPSANADLVTSGVLSALVSVVSTGSAADSLSSESFVAVAPINIDAVGARLAAGGCRVGTRMPEESHASDVFAVAGGASALSSASVSVGPAALVGLPDLASLEGVADVLTAAGVVRLGAALVGAAAAGMTVGGARVGGAGAPRAGGIAFGAAPGAGVAAGATAVGAVAAGVATMGGVGGAGASSVAGSAAPALPVAAAGASVGGAALFLDLAGGAA
jgi:hypothetical protein